MPNLKSYVDAPIMITLSVTLICFCSGILTMLKNFSNNPEEKYKLKVVKINMVAFTLSYTLKAI